MPQVSTVIAGAFDGGFQNGATVLGSAGFSLHTAGFSLRYPKSLWYPYSELPASQQRPEA